MPRLHQGAGWSVSVGRYFVFRMLTSLKMRKSLSQLVQIHHDAARHGVSPQ